MRKAERYVNMPVRRMLLAGSIAYLAGVYFTEVVFIPEIAVGLFCALFLCLGACRLRHRKRALVYLLAVLFLFGNWRTALQLRIRDEATSPGVLISGTVSRMESDLRVYLSDVLIDGERRLERPAVVTLMLDEEENAELPIPTVHVGQRIAGTGRLFEQEGKRNPGDTDGRINALSKGYDLSGYILPGWQVTGEEKPSVSELFRRLNQQLSRRIQELFGDHAPLYQAVILGDKAEMDNDLVQAMRLTGIVHILTISGMHMSLLARTMHILMLKLRLKRRLRFILQVFFLGSFACLTGFALGTIRAYIMALIRELASLTGRRYDSLTSLGAAALIMTLICPVWALSVSFQFSFFVVLGILLLSRQLSKPIMNMKNCPPWVKRLAHLAALTISAQMAAIPMQLMSYGYIPLLSMPMNLIGSLSMPLIMLGGWGTLILSIGVPDAARVMAAVLGRYSSGLESVCMVLADHPWGILRLPAPYEMSLLLVFLLMFAISEQVYMGKGRRALSAVLAAGVLLLYVPRFDPQVRYVQLDVGQGDGAVVRKNRSAVLIDIGPESEYAALRYLRHEGLFVDIVILSHADEDHAGALSTLIDSEVRVRRIALPVGALDSVGSEAVMNALTSAEEKGARIEFYEKGDEIVTEEFAFSVLSPDAWMTGSNERSLALYSEIGGMRLLTLGDLPEACEMDVVPPCDILKVAHHGSRYATSRTLLEQALPRVAIISVGRNSYGHPTDRVLEDLYAIGADVFRTDCSGCITVSAGEDGCIVMPYIKS